MKQAIEAGDQTLFVLKIGVKEAIWLYDEIERSYVKGPGPCLDELLNMLERFIKTHNDRVCEACEGTGIRVGSGGRAGYRYAVNRPCDVCGGSGERDQDSD